MVTDENVVHLLNSTNGDDVGFDLLLSKRVRRETGSEGDQGLVGGLPVDDNNLFGDIRWKTRFFKGVFEEMGGLEYGWRRKSSRRKRGVRKKRRCKGSFAADACALALALEGDVEVVVRV